MKLLLFCEVTQVEMSDSTEKKKDLRKVSGPARFFGFSSGV